MDAVYLLVLISGALVPFPVKYLHIKGVKLLKEDAMYNTYLQSCWSCYKH